MDSTGLHTQCSKDCTPGQHKVGETNCWVCYDCEGNRFSNTTNAIHCILCEAETWVNKERTSCSLTPSSVDLVGTYFGIIILALVAISGVLVSATLGDYHGNFKSILTTDLRSELWKPINSINYPIIQVVMSTNGKLLL